jgi:hypothetical protein
VKILFLTQALNAILLLPILPFLRALGRDPAVMGQYRLRRTGSLATAATIALVRFRGYARRAVSRGSGFCCPCNRALGE